MAKRRRKGVKTPWWKKVFEHWAVKILVQCIKALFSLVLLIYKRSVGQFDDSPRIREHPDRWKIRQRR